MTRLTDVIAIRHGYAFEGGKFSNDPSYPTILTPGNFAIGGGFKPARTKTYSGSIPDGYTLNPGNFIITMTDLSKQGDTLGGWAEIPDDGITYLHNQRIGLVELLRPDLASAKFLLYRSRLPDYRSHILNTATGTTVRHTSPSRIADFAIDLPSLSEQQAIAEVLAALDDKVAANRALVATTEELATGVYLRAAKVAAPLSSLARFINGKNFTKDASGSGRIVIRIAELNSGVGGSTVFSDVETEADYLARPGDILFAWSGSLTLKRWSSPEGLVNQHIFKSVPNAGVPHWLLFQAIQSILPEFKGIAADKATTMGHIQRHHLDMSALVPEAPNDIDPLMSGFWHTLLATEQESATLASLRDTLLPALMDGTIRVKDAVTAAEEVL